MKRKIVEALENLNDLIDIGVDFSDAVWNTSVAYEVDSDELEDAYNDQMLNKG